MPSRLKPPHKVYAVDDSGERPVKESYGSPDWNRSCDQMVEQMACKMAKKAAFDATTAFSLADRDIRALLLKRKREKQERLRQARAEKRKARKKAERERERMERLAMEAEEEAGRRRLGAIAWT